VTKRYARQGDLCERVTRPRKPERIRPFAAALSRVAQADFRLRAAAADHLGLALADFDAVQYLADAGPVPAGRIAEAMSITSGAVTGLVDRLERTGWVERARHDHDRRQVVVQLAAVRRDAIDGGRALRERLLGEALGELDASALAEAATLLDAAAEQLAAGAAELLRDRNTASESEGAADAGDRAAIGGIAHGRLRFSGGASQLELRGARIKDLYRATFAGKRPLVTVDPSGEVSIRYKGFSWFGWRDVGAQLTLTTLVPWSIEIRRGLSHLAANLSELQISQIEITGGASESRLSLPQPRGTATLRVTGGASRMKITRPRGSAAQMVVRGGASNLVFDAQQLGAVGGATRLATPGWDAATDRWAIEVTGGASDLSVTED
jgi:DNA-binding MarR family transcriptional regulator